MSHAPRVAATAAGAPDEPYARAAARAVRAAAAAPALRPAAGPPGDAGSVRAVRRAARRLRTALELHAPCFPRAEHRRAVRDVRLLLDALGTRRDHDVALGLVAELRPAVPPADRPGLDGWRTVLAARRDAADAELAVVLGEVCGTGSHARLEALASAAEQLADAAAAPGDPAAHGHRRDVRALDARTALDGSVPAAGASDLAPADDGARPHGGRTQRSAPA